MKSYQQYCGLARGLDLVGDRWTLLVIRELALGDRRYAQLQRDLPGIPTNLLADRLRSLTASGLIEPTAGTARSGGYALTPRGREIVPVLHALVRWSTPTMLDGPDADDHQSARWVAFAAMAYLRSAPAGSPVSIKLSCGAEHVVIRADHGVTISLDDELPTDVTIDGNAWALMGIVSGALPIGRVRAVDDSAAIVGTQASRRRATALIAHNTAAAS